MKLVQALVLIATWSTATLAAAVQTIDLPVDPPSRRTETLSEIWRLGEEEEAAPLEVIFLTLP